MDVIKDNTLLSGKDWINDDPKTYVVLGCPCSGTSFIANALTKMGAKMGATSWRHEDMGFVKLNAKIINGSWSQPPSHDSIMESAKNFTKDIKELLDERRKNYLFGWKDPRQPLTIEAYLPYLTDDVYLVCIFRKPSYTLQSMRKQIGSKGDKMAKEYARRTIRAVMKFMGITPEDILKTGKW